MVYSSFIENPTQESVIVVLFYRSTILLEQGDLWKKIKVPKTSYCLNSWLCSCLSFSAMILRGSREIESANFY